MIFSSRSKSDKKSETSSSLLREVMYGRIVSGDFFARNWMAMLLLVLLALVYIAGKYTCQTKMETVQRLTRDIEIVSTDAVRAKARYEGRVRESEMQRMADENGLGLSVREEPSYIITSSRKQ